MKKTIVLILLFCCAAQAQEFRPIQDGIEHAQITRQVQISDQETAPVVVNLLRLDLTKTRLDVVHAMDSAIGVEQTSSIALRHGAVAAVNAGFFRLDNSIFKGEATGILVIDDVPYSEPFANRIALFISNDDATHIDFKHLNINYSLFLRKSEIRVSGMNRQRGENELIIYTNTFHRTTLTDSNGVEIFVNSKDRIWKISDGAGSSAIQRKGYILSASGEMRKKLLSVARIGGFVQAGLRYSEPKAEIRDLYLNSEDIVGGVPQLIKDGKIEITWELEKSSKEFVETRHPRTVIAKLEDGRALLVTVDGRQQGVSAGMNLEELAEMLLEMSATDAMNLDGGGSTTMFLNGKVVNKPSDKEGERPVSDAILVTLRKKK